MDCEMDLLEKIYEGIDEQRESEKEHKVCKISIVNQDGQIILDTLVDYRKKGQLHQTTPTIQSNSTNMLKND